MGAWDWSKIRDFLEALVIVWGFVSGGIVLWLRGSFITRARFELEIKRLDAAIASCRSNGVTESGELRLAVQSLVGTLKAIDERLKSGDHQFERLEAQNDRILSYLLENAK